MMLNGGLYLAIGDSITRYCPDATNTQADRNVLYTHLLRNYIINTYGKIKLINKGIDGHTTINAIANYYHNSRFQPTIVTISLGTNDCANNGVGITAYKANLSAMIDKLKTKNANVKIILCSPPRTSEATRVNYIQSYRDACAEVATSKNVYLCKFEDAYTVEQVATYCPDGLHPNKAGHVLLFNLLKPIIDEILG